jgi:hypothetical protein
VSKVKRLLVGVLVVGALTALIGAGTFATFDATTSNSSTFQSGTIILSNTVTPVTGTACLSTAANSAISAGNTASCDALFASTLQKPGQTATGHLTLVNVGSLNASTLSLYAASACSNSHAPDANGDYGVGDLCSQLQLTVQEKTDNTFTTNAACVYGTAAGAACTFDAAHTPAAFSGSYTSLAPLTLAGTLNTATPRYFVISVFFPSASNNTFQGDQDNLVLDWTAAQ